MVEKTNVVVLLLERLDLALDERVERVEGGLNLVRYGEVHDGPYLNASGLIGEPTPWVTFSGGAQKKNSHTLSAAQSAASSSKSSISPRVRPMSRMSTMCT